MPKISASQLLYQQILLAYKIPFYDATHRLPNSYRPVAVGPHRETESHTAFRSSNCEMRLKRSGWHRHKSVLQISVPRPRSQSVPRRGQRAPPGHAWQLLLAAERFPEPPSRRGPLVRKRSPPEQRPPPPRSSRGTLSAEPRLPQRGLSPCPHNRDCAARKRRGWCGGDPGRGEGCTRASLSPCGSPTFPEAETAAAGAADRVPGQERLPSPLNMMSGFPLPSPPVPLALPRSRCPAPPARPPRREGGREGESPRCGPAPPLPRFPGAARTAAPGPAAGPGDRGSPRRCHGAQTAAPFRGREWGRRGGMEGPGRGGRGQARRRPRPPWRRGGGARPCPWGEGPSRPRWAAGGQAGAVPVPHSSGGGRIRRAGAALGLLRDSKPASKQAASDPRGPVFDFSVELHKALILDVVVCCYLPFTRTFSFIAVIKGQYLASAFSLC